jgi:tetratricopeptide (TPR) repeat protein
VADVAIGNEHVLKTRLNVVDGQLTYSGGTEMLLGADFIMAHRIYVSRRLHQIAFTYVGGNPFVAFAHAPRSNTTSGPLALPGGMTRVEASADKAFEPKTADDFARRASLRLTQKNGRAAIEDYSAAIKLAPDTARYYRDRSRAYANAGNHALARADIDHALGLDPRDGELLVARAQYKLRDKDHSGAVADLDVAVKVIAPASLDIGDVAGGYIEAAQPARAVALLGPVIAAHQEDSHLGELLNTRCWARGLANIELQAALADCNRAIRRSGANPEYLDSRALVYYRQGQFKAAVTEYDSVVTALPKEGWSRFMRGAAKAKLGDAEGAKADRDDAVKVDAGVAQYAARYGLP